VTWHARWVAEGIVRAEQQAAGGPTTLRVTLNDAVVVEASALDPSQPAAFEFDVDRAPAAEVQALTGRSIDDLRSAALTAAGIELREPDEDVWARLARLAALEAFVRRGYLSAGQLGLVLGEQVAVRADLEDLGFRPAREITGLAIASVGAVLRLGSLDPLSEEPLAAVVVRAVTRYLPREIARHLDPLLFDVADPSTIALWVELDRYPRSSMSARAPVLLGSRTRSRPRGIPAFRGATSASSSLLEWPILWPEGLPRRAPDVDGATARLERLGEGAYRVRVSPAPSEAGSAQVFLRLVQRSAQDVVTVAPLLRDDEGLIGHLHLDEGVDPASYDIEVAAWPDAPVVGEEAYVQGLYGQWAIARLRAHSLDDSQLAQRLHGWLESMGAVLGQSSGRVLGPLLVDQVRPNRVQFHPDPE